MNIAETMDRILNCCTQTELEILEACFNNYNRCNLQYSQIVNIAHNKNKEGIDYSKEINIAKKRKLEARENLIGAIQLLDLKYPAVKSAKKG